MKKNNPPKLAQKFFSWYCRNHLHDSILGDLDERFFIHAQKVGLNRARLKYWLEVIGFMNRFTLKREHSINPLFMLRSNIISSVRFLKRNVQFAMINMVGLTIGLTSFLLILFFVRHELAFDNFHQNKENVYRINFSFSDNSGNTTTLVNSPPAFAPGIQGKLPEISKISRMRYTANCLLAIGERSFYEDHGYYADSLFLEILAFGFHAGNPTTALDEPNSIVLTKEMALKYFDVEDPVGATLLFNNTIPLKVTGIISSIPSNSHLNFDFLISFPTYVVPDGYASDLESWDWLGFLTYVELEKGTDHEHFQRKLEQFLVERDPADTSPMKPKVQPLSEIYLGSNAMSDDLASYIRTGNKVSVYSLMTIAILILVIACFNFSNLTNALSINRGKAIGIKKVLGAKRGAVINQLVTETVLLAMCCLAVSVGLAILLFPKLALLLEWDISLGFSEIFSTTLIMVGTALLLGVVAGLYPAILLSGLSITKSLKGDLKVANKNPFQFKNMVVLVQFSISIGLIVATFVFLQQVNFLNNRSTGFNKENIVVIKLLPDDMARYFRTYKAKMTQYSSVLGVSSSDRVVGEGWPFSGIRLITEDPEQIKMTYFNLVGHDYFKTMGIKVLEGRSFSEENSRDVEDAVVINKKAVVLLGLEDPVGKQVHFFNADGPRTIIGVVDDFNYTSLHQDIGPVAMILPFIHTEYIYVRLTPGNLHEHIDLITRTWEQIAPGTPLDWRLLDDRLDQLYKAEEKLSYLISVFSILAVFLACLGLYGIVAFSISNRLKEFGVRRVLGASVYSLNILFVKQYVYQIVASMIIITPLLHYYLNTWLQTFAYRIDIIWWIYPGATLLLLTIALFTITIQTTKAAKANPVHVLKSE